MKFKEIWPSGSRGEVVQMYKRTDGRRTTDDGRGVITIAHSEPSARVS